MSEQDGQHPLCATGITFTHHSQASPGIRLLPNLVRPGSCGMLTFAYQLRNQHRKRWAHFQIPKSHLVRLREMFSPQMEHYSPNTCWCWREAEEGENDHIAYNCPFPQSDLLDVDSTQVLTKHQLSQTVEGFQSNSSTTNVNKSISTGSLWGKGSSSLTAVRICIT